MFTTSTWNSDTTILPGCSHVFPVSVQFERCFTVYNIVALQSSRCPWPLWYCDQVLAGILGFLFGWFIKSWKFVDDFQTWCHLALNCAQSLQARLSALTCLAFSCVFTHCFLWHLTTILWLSSCSELNADNLLYFVLGNDKSALGMQQGPFGFGQTTSSEWGYTKLYGVHWRQVMMWWWLR